MNLLLFETSIAGSSAVSFSAARPFSVFLAAVCVLASVALRAGALHDAVAWLAWARATRRRLLDRYGAVVYPPRRGVCWGLFDDDEEEDPAPEAAAEEEQEGGKGDENEEENTPVPPAAPTGAGATGAVGAAAAMGAPAAASSTAAAAARTAGAPVAAAASAAATPPKPAKPALGAAANCRRAAGRVSSWASRAAAASTATLRAAYEESAGFVWSYYGLGVGVSLLEQVAAGYNQVVGFAALGVMERLGRGVDPAEGAEGASGKSAAALPLPPAALALIAAAARRAGFSPEPATMVIAPLVGIFAFELTLHALLLLLGFARKAAFSAARGSRSLDRKRRFVRACIVADLAFHEGVSKLTYEARPNEADADRVDVFLAETAPSVFTEACGIVRNLAVMAALDLRLGVVATAAALVRYFCASVSASSVSLFEFAEGDLFNSRYRRPGGFLLPLRPSAALSVQMMAREEDITQSFTTGDSADASRLPLLKEAMCLPETFYTSAVESLCANALNIAAGLKMLASLAPASTGGGSGASAAAIVAFGYLEYSKIQSCSYAIGTFFAHTLPNLRNELQSASRIIKRYRFFLGHRNQANAIFARAVDVAGVGPDRAAAQATRTPSSGGASPRAASQALFRPVLADAAQRSGTKSPLATSAQRSGTSRLAEAADVDTARWADGSSGAATTDDDAGDAAEAAAAAAIAVSKCCLVDLSPAGGAQPPDWRRAHLRGHFVVREVTFSYPHAPELQAEMGLPPPTRASIGQSWAEPRLPARKAPKPNKKLLRGLSLEIPAGSTFGIAGASGCGKSTLLRLLTRLYEPTGGSIELDGRPLAAFEPRSLRRAIGWVSQEADLLAGLTVTQSILLGLEREFGLPMPWEPKPGDRYCRGCWTMRTPTKAGDCSSCGQPLSAAPAPAEGKVTSAAAPVAAPAAAPVAASAAAAPDLARAHAAAERAARTAHIHDYIAALPNGYDEVLKADKMSGGERQRFAIARAVARDPPILLLDEATSALDADNERAVVAALAEAGRGRTTIIIAHKLPTLRRADCIVVLKKGAVVEQGTFDQLMARGGLFADMAGPEEQIAAAVRRGERPGGASGGGGSNAGTAGGAGAAP